MHCRHVRLAGLIIFAPKLYTSSALLATYLLAFDRKMSPVGDALWMRTRLRMIALQMTAFIYRLFIEWSIGGRDVLLQVLYSV